MFLGSKDNAGEHGVKLHGGSVKKKSCSMLDNIENASEYKTCHEKKRIHFATSNTKKSKQTNKKENRRTGIMGRYNVVPVTNNKSFQHRRRCKQKKGDKPIVSNSRCTSFRSIFFFN